MRTKFLLFFLLICFGTYSLKAQYYSNSQTIYKSTSGNLILTATSTSTNLSRPDKAIFLKGKNNAVNGREFITWTNGGVKEVRTFVYTLLSNTQKPIGSTFLVDFKYTATVLDNHTIKVHHLAGGYTLFNKDEMYLLLESIKNK